MPTDTWFIKIEIELRTGRTFKSSLTRAETAELAKGFVVQEDQADADLGLVRAAFNTLAYRAEKGSGGLVLPDAEGRTWYFDGGAIAAFGFQHRLNRPDSTRAIPFGFRSPQDGPS
jgi:hypothetical protein